jgi:hypothetical protein
MKMGRSSSWVKKTLFASFVVVALMLITQVGVRAQTNFKPGDKVMASPSMLKDEKYYKPCTVVKFDRSANAYLLDCDGTEYFVPPAYVRAAATQTDANEDERTDLEKLDKPAAKPARNNGQFKVGDRVLASVSGLKDDRYYQPCTVIRGLKDNSYGLRCDPHNGQPVMEYSFRPEWIKSEIRADEVFNNLEWA